MPVLLRILGALVLTFWISRLTLRLPNPFQKTGGLVLAHLVSLILSGGLLMLMRSPLGVFAPRQLLIVMTAQLCWLVFDRMCHTYPRGTATLTE